MQLDPRRLLILHAIARHGGVVGAATALRISPSAISQQLAQLERELGMGLVDRSKRGGQRPLQLTAAGLRVLRHADNLAGVLDIAEADLTAMTGVISGPVVIAAFFTVLRGFVGEALASLSHTHPQLLPRVVDWDEHHTIGDLRSGKLDLAIVDEDGADRQRTPSNLRFEPLVEDAFRLAVPSSWPEIRELSDIAGRPWVGGPVDSAVGHALKRMRRTTGLAFPTAHSTREFTAALAIVATGLAAAFVPELALTAAPPPLGVRVMTLPGLGCRRLGAMHRQSRNEPTPAVDAVLHAFRVAAAGANRKSTPGP